MSNVVQMGLQIFFGYLELQTVHTGVGLHGGRIDGLGMAAHHSLFHAQGQYPCEHFLKNGLGEQLPSTAYRTVPWQFLVDIITDKIEDVQTHRTMVDEFSVADDILEISN